MKITPTGRESNVASEKSASVQGRDSKPDANAIVWLDALGLFVAGFASPQNGRVSAPAESADSAAANSSKRRGASFFISIFNSF